MIFNFYNNFIFIFFMISFTTRASPKKDALFDDEYVLRVPSEEEVRIVGIRLRNCTKCK